MPERLALLPRSVLPRVLRGRNGPLTVHQCGDVEVDGFIAVEEVDKARVRVGGPVSSPPDHPAERLGRPGQLDGHDMTGRCEGVTFCST